jgi:hypothetical protein
LGENAMGLSPDALFLALSKDLGAYTPFGPVGLGDMPPEASYKQFVSSYLLSNITKKWYPKDTRRADENAKEKFLASNKKCKDWRLRVEMESDRELIGEFQRELDDFFHPGGLLLVPNMFELLEHARVGPGSAVGARGFSLYAKLFSSQLTTTSLDLDFAFRGYIARFPRFDEAVANCRQILGEPLIVEGSRCSFAPKTTDCSRMICVEPSLNMYYQLGLGAVLEARLRDQFRLDLATQPQMNRRLAQYGSKTGRFATIDLSSASDSISLRMCKRFLPKWVYYLLVRLRSPVTRIGDQTVRLNMMSTMGNGFTFPLQTIIFSSLIRAAYRVSGFEIHDSNPNWACFGDDLIVEAGCFRNVCRLLDLLGFVRNSAKTFNEGPFRESCGTDWYFGQPVRPVFVKKLDSLQDIFVSINLLNEWSSYTGIPLIEGISYLMSGIRRDLGRFYVPYIENNESGIRVPSICLSKSTKFDMNYSRIYRPFRAIPKRIMIGEEAIVVPRGIKDLIFNPQGLEISFLYGEVECYALNVRQSHVRYSQRRNVIPWWDYFPITDSYYGKEFDWQQWETAVLINMSNPGR